ncbi:glycosyl hydrolase family 7 protein [Kalaharituber pfeilii]|nr:glycosyl hydrolase family 7 protein [Kalaharituber pfeilii]
MFNTAALFSFVLLATARAQQVGTLTSETHPRLSWQQCSAGGSCTTTQASIVLDSNWRWTHQTGNSNNCYEGSAWLGPYCDGNDGARCAQNCAIEGADYSGTYGITTSGSELTLKFVTTNQYGQNVGSRVYLMAPDDTKYQIFKPNNKEFTFDVDVSNLPCGLNGALYFVEMAADGGLSKYPNNKAGAKYGTGYCDAQCPHDIKWINGEGNIQGWNPSETDPNAASGRYGTCCPEMDIWEANSMATAFTPHPCYISGQYRCDGATECGDGSSRYSSVCDKDGCDFNSFRMGNTSFYGLDKIVNTRQKMTVVTQFITADGTDTGALSEIRRIYVQNGRVIANSVSNISGVSGNSLTDQFCLAQKTAFNHQNQFRALGGMAGMGKAQQAGVVLVMSIWADHATHMLWLDSTYPLDRPETAPGIKRGECSRDSGDPDDMVANHANASVKFSNIKFGPIGSTYSGGSTNPGTSTAGPPTTPTTTSSGSSPTGAALYGQCGGQGWTGPTTCAQGTCRYTNPWYSQCLP